MDIYINTSKLCLKYSSIAQNMWAVEEQGQERSLPSLFAESTEA